MWELTVSRKSHVLDSAIQLYGNVVHEVRLLSLLVAEGMPERSWLHEVIVSNVAFELGRSSHELLVGGGLFVLFGLDDRRGLDARDVVGDGSIVHDVRGAVTLGRVICIEGSVGG